MGAVRAEQRTGSRTRTSARPKDRLLQTARDTARGRLLTLGAGLFAGGALLLAARDFVLSRRGQVTDRYTKAIEQLGSRGLDVRIGGIYALEGVARDSARDHPMVMEVLTAFVREHSREQWPPPDSPRTTWITWRGRFRTGGRQQERFTRPDVQAAVTVLGRRDAKRDIQPIDLNGADLTGADPHRREPQRREPHRRHLSVTRTSPARTSPAPPSVTRTSPARTSPSGPHAGADLGGADLTEATLRSTDLRSTDLQATTLIRATLTRADLTSAFLGGADLTDATLAGADLGSADLTRARLFRTDFTRADLSGATLTEATLTGAKWPGGSPVPQGWKLDTRAGRLIAATGTDSGPAEVS